MLCSTHSATLILATKHQAAVQTMHTTGQNADRLCAGLQDRMQTASAQGCARLDPQSQREGKLMPCSSQRGQRFREHMGEEEAEELGGAPLQGWAGLARAGEGM